MAYSIVAICNLALMRLGVSRLIDALDEGSTESALCDQVYENVRDEVLRAFEWPFAAAEEELGLLEEEPTDEWAYSYTVPSDCVAVRRLVDGTRVATNTIPYAIVEGTGGRVIHTDQAEAVAQYTRRVTDPAQFTPDFASLLAWRIASEVGLPLIRDARLAERAEGRYLVALSRAQSAASREREPDDDPEAGSIRARG